MAQQSIFGSNIAQRSTVKEEQNRHIQGEWTYQQILPNEMSVLRQQNEASVSITESTSAGVNFYTAIQKNYGDTNIPASAQFTFTNFGNTTSTGQVTALYEHIRGYVYRDNSLSALGDWSAYLSSSNSGFVVSQSTTAIPPCLPTGTGALSAVRVLLMNRSVYGDRIKEGTFRLSFQPVSIVFPTQALIFNNSNVTQSDSGEFASITGADGLSGSLSSGVSGSVVTGFSVCIRFKPIVGGPQVQTLFDRRLT